MLFGIFYHHDVLYNEKGIIKLDENETYVDIDRDIGIEINEINEINEIKKNNNNSISISISQKEENVEKEEKEEEKEEEEEERIEIIEISEKRKYFEKEIRNLCSYLKKDLVSIYQGTHINPLTSNEECDYFINVNSNSTELIVVHDELLGRNRSELKKKKLVIFVHIVSLDRLDRLKRTWFKSLEEEKENLEFYNIQIEICTWSTAVKQVDYFIPGLQMKDELTKLKLILLYLFNNHRDGDWFFRSDDDTYIVMRNFVPFLRLLPYSEEPMAVGYIFTRRHLSGGGGFIFNKKALELHNEVINKTCSKPQCDTYDDKHFAEKLGYFFPQFKVAFDHVGFYYGAPYTVFHFLLDYSTNNHNGICGRRLNPHFWKGFSPITFHKFNPSDQEDLESHQRVPSTVFQVDISSDNQKIRENTLKCQKLFSEDDRFQYELISKWDDQNIMNNYPMIKGLTKIKGIFARNIESLENVLSYNKIFKDGGIFIHKSYKCENGTIEDILSFSIESFNKGKEGFIKMNQEKENIDVMGYRRWTLSSYIMFRDTFFCELCNKNDTGYEYLRYAILNYPDLQEDTNIIYNP